MIPPEIGPSDHVGRRIRQGDDAKRAAKGRIDHRAFVDSAPKVSVDRLGIVTDDVLALIADAETLPPRKFHGWAALPVAKILELGREIEVEETATNPYHANILLTEDEQVDKEARKDLAHRLSLIAEWRPRPLA